MNTLILHFISNSMSMKIIMYVCIASIYFWIEYTLDQNWALRHWNDSFIAEGTTQNTKFSIMIMQYFWCQLCNVFGNWFFCYFLWLIFLITLINWFILVKKSKQERYQNCASITKPVHYYWSKTSFLWASMTFLLLGNFCIFKLTFT